MLIHHVICLFSYYYLHDCFSVAFVASAEIISVPPLFFTCVTHQHVARIVCIFPIRSMIWLCHAMAGLYTRIYVAVLMDLTITPALIVLDGYWLIKSINALVTDHENKMTVNPLESRRFNRLIGLLCSLWTLCTQPNPDCTLFSMRIATIRRVANTFISMASFFVARCDAGVANARKRTRQSFGFPMQPPSA